jgi:hypothetical protein
VFLNLAENNLKFVVLKKKFLNFFFLIFIIEKKSKNINTTNLPSIYMLLLISDTEN